VLRAAGRTETTQENIQDSLKLDEADPRFQLLTEEETPAVIFVYLFLSALLHCPFICFLSLYLFLLGLSFAALIRMTSPSPLNP
jgi:hypothetical protein